MANIKFKIKKMKNLKYIIFLLIVVSCNGQDKKDDKSLNISVNKSNKMREKFDFEEYNKRTSAVHNITKNGSLVEMVSDEQSGGHYNIKLPKPSFEIIYKEFNKEGLITKKEHYLGVRTKVGISEYYDELGNLKTVDEEKKFGKIKPIDALKFLEKKGILNLKTGVAKQTTYNEDDFEISFEETQGKKQYIISILEGKPNNEPFPKLGEPKPYLPVNYIMDGETGNVEEVK